MDDPFTVLGLTPTYLLDLDETERRHRSLSQALHPDRYAGAPPSERRMALGRAIAVNEAFRTLKDPVTRAEALLTRLGAETPEELKTAMDPEFLMHVVEQREALATAKHQANLGQIRDFIAKGRQAQSELTAELGRSFEVVLRENQPSTELLEVRRRLSELRFCRRLLEEARAAEEDLS